MPNHCENNVSIEGDMYDLLRFWEAMQYDDEIRLANLVPMPDGLNDRDGDWCGWAIENWGTKWGDYEHSVDIVGPDYLELGYHTAWCPFEDQFWHKVSRMFPTLKFTVSYEESGMVFCGVDSYRNGETLASRYVNDYTEIIGTLEDWEDSEKWEEWQDRLTKLRENLSAAILIIEQVNGH